MEDSNNVNYRKVFDNIRSAWHCSSYTVWANHQTGILYDFSSRRACSFRQNELKLNTSF